MALATASTTLTNDRVRFSFSFQRLGTAVPANPPVVKVAHRSPSGVETVFTSPTVVNESTGNFHIDIQVTEPRTHYFLAQGSGDPELEKSIEASLFVPESAFNDPTL